MNKPEIVEMALDQLLETFKVSPESLEYKDRNTGAESWSYSTVIWQPRFELKTDRLGQIIADPNNTPKTVVVFYNDNINIMSVLIFNKTFISSTDMNITKPDAAMSCSMFMMKWRSPYRKLMRLKKLILNRTSNRENEAFMRKLLSVFPGSLDRHIFK